MRQTSRLCLLAGAVFGISGGALAESGQAWSNADEVRALVSEMQADAETRSSLLQSGGSAGHDGRHFFLGSADGNFRLELSGQIQFRYYLNFRDDNDADGNGAAEDDFESGFQTRRTKLFFEGHVFDPNLFYRVSANFYDDTIGGTNDGDLQLEDAFAGYRWDNGFSMMWGQFKLPFLREELVSSGYQLAADRSLVNETFNQDRSQGVQLGYESEDFRMAFAFSDGFASENSEYGTTPHQVFNANGYPSAGESDYAFTLRAEIKFAGNWDQFQDFTSMPGSDYACMLGIAGHIQGDNEDSFASPAGVTVLGGYNFYGWTADISVEGDGWNFYVAGVGEYSDYDLDTDGDGAADAATEFGDYGVVAQFGMFIPDTDWEPFLRYDGIFADEDERGLTDDNNNFNTLTFGVNYYMYGHASKFTFDFVWFIDDVNANALGAGVPQPGIGYLTDDDDNELAFRIQWQLLF